MVMFCEGYLNLSLGVFGFVCDLVVGEVIVLCMYECWELLELLFIWDCVLDWKFFICNY